MSERNFIKLLITAVAIAASLFGITGCQRAPVDKQTVAPASLRDISALKLNFRFEPDVPAPTETHQPAPIEEKNAAIQNDFDTNRAQEVLEKTFTSPDKQRVIAVYRKTGDSPEDYRLDVYAPDGRLVRRVTPNGMAVRFPDTIVWSPDSNSIAFVGATRLIQAAAATPPERSAPVSPEANTSTTNGSADANANAAANANASASPVVPGAPAAAATPGAGADQPKPVLTFRTEQIYTCNREGIDLKPLTQNDGLIYFYFVWAPDSSALVSLAATWREWQFTNSQANLRGEIFIPGGRPRLVETTGRERRLDDNVTTVQPVWSPDSAKVALAYNTDIRIYDAIGDIPTQAAIPLRNPLLISSKTFDEELRRKEQAANTNGGGAANANTAGAVANNNTGGAQANANAQTSAPVVNTDVNTLPDENTLVSFNPIIELEWSEDKMLYVLTGYVKEMKNSADSAHSYMRWHRLVFSPQAVAIN